MEYRYVRMGDVDKKIVIAGMFRSGSTLLYNYIRLACIEYFGKDSVYSAYAAKYNYGNGRRVHLIKSHAYIDFKETHVVLSYRDLRDVIASMKLGGYAYIDNSLVKTLSMITEWHDKWKEKNPCYIDYNEINNIDIYRRINNYLGIECNSNKIFQNANSLKYKKADEKYDHDRINLLHPNHNQRGGSYYKEVLTINELDIINNFLETWQQ